MAGVSRLGDSIEGMTSGEHNGHIEPHPPCPITGTINGNCSSNVFINGKPAAFVGSTTIESDCCDSGKSGSISRGSSSVFVNGKPIARIGDNLSPHNGTAKISGGSSNVFAGG